MTNLLLRFFVRDSMNPDDTRKRCGMLSGIVGIVCNVLLTGGKFFIGSITHSIAITADALNNLSDAGASAVTLVGFKAASRPADDEHPFGHGRMEYVAALVVSFLVLLMGLELIKSSIDKILHPEPLVFSVPALIVLLLSVAVKLWMAYFNTQLGKRIHSPATKAVVADSLSDTAATSASILALVLSKFTTFPLDGIMGILVAAFILYTGVGIVRDTIGPLLGETPDPELVQKIEKKILSYDGIVGVHDLMIHNYGPNRIFASAHAEIPANSDIMESHDTIDVIERAVLQEFHIAMVLHMDPIVTDDGRINELRLQMAALVKEIDPRLTIHDFRVVDGPTHTNLIFDLVRPHQFPMKDSDLRQIIDRKLCRLNGNYYAVVTVECSYIAQPDI